MDVFERGVEIHSEISENRPVNGTHLGKGVDIDPIFKDKLRFSRKKYRKINSKDGINLQVHNGKIVEKKEELAKRELQLISS